MENKQWLIECSQWRDDMGGWDTEYRLITAITSEDAIGMARMAFPQVGWVFKNLNIE